jgi:hypothetical protein
MRILHESISVMLGMGLLSASIVIYLRLLMLL